MTNDHSLTVACFLSEPRPGAEPICANAIALHDAHSSSKRRATKTFIFLLLLSLVFAVARPSAPVCAASFVPDRQYLADREALDKIQRDAFRYIWEDGDPASGMAYEANFQWKDRPPVAVGGTGFGIAAIVVAADRRWITREQAVDRIMKIAAFLRDKTPRTSLHGAFPHWLNGNTGHIFAFGPDDGGADIVETSYLMQGLLIARAYFNGPGVEEKLRSVITELWEDVEWDWFANGKEEGLYWHWDPERGFNHGLIILGYNECMITYVLAASSPTHPISRKTYDHWTSGPDYQPREANGYRIEASPAGGGPLFLAHYSFIGLDPHHLADRYVPSGYFVRGVKQTLANRGYCLWEAPADNHYGEDFWGLTASQAKGGYAVNQPLADSGTVAPTAAICSMPYTPYYSLQVLRNLQGELKKKIWGKNGPYDAINLRDGWISDLYLAIDQLPMVSMVENYRSGLLWKLFMSDPDVRQGLKKAGLSEPDLSAGFPEAIIAMRRNGADYAADAFDVCRHPDTGMFSIPYWCNEKGDVSFSLATKDGEKVFSQTETAVKGRNYLVFGQFMPPNGKILTLIMRTGDGIYRLPVRLH